MSMSILNMFNFLLWYDFYNKNLYGGMFLEGNIIILEGSTDLFWPWSCPTHGIVLRKLKVMTTFIIQESDDLIQVTFVKMPPPSSKISVQLRLHF